MQFGSYLDCKLLRAIKIISWDNFKFLMLKVHYIVLTVCNVLKYQYILMILLSMKWLLPAYLLLTFNLNTVIDFISSLMRPTRNNTWIFKVLEIDVNRWCMSIEIFIAFSWYANLDYRACFRVILKFVLKLINSFEMLDCIEHHCHGISRYDV